MDVTGTGGGRSAVRLGAVGRLEAARGHVPQRLHRDAPPGAFCAAILHARAERQRCEESEPARGSRLTELTIRE